MNKNIMIVMGGALVVAVLVAILVQMALGGKKKEPVSTAPAFEVLVAAKDLKIGSTLTEGDLRWQKWPQNAVFSGAIRREGDQGPDGVIVGRLARNVSAGEPIVKTALLETTKGNFVAASLKEGQRAVAVEVKASTMAGGFISPGDYVDVILTYRGRMYSINKDDMLAEAVIARNMDKLATETILQNIRVLAVDQTASRSEEEKIKVGRTVTLSVTAEEAEKIALAREMGDITLALRGVGDNKIIEEQWPTISDTRMMTVDDEIVEEYEKIRNEAGISGNIMRIYNGGEVTAVQTK